MVGLADDETSLGVLQYRGESRWWMPRLQRQVKLAGLEDAQEGYKGFGTMVEQQRHRFRSATALAHNGPRYPIGSSIERLVGEVICSDFDGQARRIVLDLLRKPRHDRLLNSCFRTCLKRSGHIQAVPRGRRQ